MSAVASLRRLATTDTRMRSERVIKSVVDELDRAVKKHPVWPTDLVHAAAIVGEESGELLRASIQWAHESGELGAVLEEARHVAATAIRFLYVFGETSPERLSPLQPSSTIAHWLDPGELAEPLPTTMDDLLAACGNLMDRSCTWEILGNPKFADSHGQVYAVQLCAVPVREDAVEEETAQPDQRQDIPPVSELLETWRNGNRKDVIDVLESSHPCVTALFLTTGIADKQLGGADRNIVTNMLLDRKIEQNMSS